MAKAKAKRKESKEEVKKSSHLWNWLTRLDPNGEPKHKMPMGLSYASNCVKRTYLSKPAFEAEVRRLRDVGLIDLYAAETQGTTRIHKKWMIDVLEPILDWSSREKAEYNGVTVEKDVLDAFKKLNSTGL